MLQNTSRLREARPRRALLIYQYPQITRCTMKILLAVDGSNCSNGAVREVARRPWPKGTEIRIISAVEVPFMPTPETWALPDSYYAQLEQAGREQAGGAVKQAADAIRENPSPLTVATAILDGHPRDVIIEEADKWGADLIVIGSHGSRGLQRFLLGSVSQAVAAHAHCSVEIVRCRETGQK